MKTKNNKKETKHQRDKGELKQYEKNLKKFRETPEKLNEAFRIQEEKKRHYNLLRYRMSLLSLKINEMKSLRKGIEDVIEHIELNQEEVDKNFHSINSFLIRLYQDIGKTKEKLQNELNKEK